MIICTDTFGTIGRVHHVKHMRQIWADEKLQQATMIRKLPPERQQEVRRDMEALEKEYQSLWRR